MFKKEWAYIKDHKMLMLIIAGLLVVPVMYAAVFLKGVWDPYGQLDDLPVAVVNEDVAASFEGNELHIGDELVENLQDNDQFDWQFVDRDRAMSGIDEGDFYMVIVVPEYFSERATTALDEDPQEMELEYYTSAGQNFIAEQIVGTAASTVEQQVAETVSREYIATLFDVLAELADGFAEAADGADELEEGGEDLFNNLDTLASNTLTFQDGLDEAENGSNAIATNLSDLVSGSIELRDGVDTYTSAVEMVTSGAIAYTDATDTLASGASQFVAGAEQLANGTMAYTNSVEGALAEVEPALLQLRTPVAEAQATLAALNESNSLVLDYTNGVTTLTEGVGTYTTGVSLLTSGVAETAETVVDVSNGLHLRLQDTSGLENVSESLISGSQSVQTGLDTLVPGLVNVQSGLFSFSTEVQQFNDDVADLASMSASAYGRLEERLDEVEAPEITETVQALTLLRDELNAQDVGGASAPSLSGLIQLINDVDAELGSIDQRVAEGKAEHDAQTIRAIQESDVDLTDEQRATLISEISQVQSEQVLPTVVSESRERIERLLSEVNGIEGTFAGLDELADSLTRMESSVESGIQSLEGIEAQVADTKESIADAVLETVGEVNRRIQTVAGASEQMANGLDQLDVSTQALVEGAEALQPGATAVAEGVESASTEMLALAENAEAIQSQLTSVRDGANEVLASLATLDEGGAALQEGASSLEGATESIADTAEGFIGASDGLSAQANAGLQLLNQFEAGTDLLQDAGSTLRAGSSELQQQGQTLTSGAQALTEEGETLANGAAALSGTGAELTDGADTLATGSPELQSGAETLEEALGELYEGSGSLYDGTIEIQEGSTDIIDGADELAVTLQDAADDIRNENKEDGNAEMMAHPTTLDQTKVTEVPNYGHGLAPYMMSVGLFVGAVIFCILFPIKEPVVTPTSGIMWWLSKFSILAFVSFFQAVIMIGIMVSLVGLEPVDTPRTFLVAIVTSFAFMSMVHFFSVLLGNVGRFIMLILMTIQLGGAAGTFPIELSNSFFQAVHPYLPMTHSVNAFREAISIGGTAWFEMTILLVLFVAFHVFTIIYYTFSAKKRQEEASEEELQAQT
ncbi:YhgE/Pip family protein [Shouchella sp. JSM 1781072]|uniref:YhgE/Pip family protein n=1 Tax=Shouchella sp. JSM 1781072 TaxID=3344581 RepID=UPI0035C24480